jgi:hypothetical protein
MKITQIKTKQINEQVITDILCNKCGQSCKKECGFLGLIEAKVSGGFDSYPLSDGVNYTFSICEHCLNSMFDKFKIPVEESS